jgi:hypothetical protein
VKERWFQPGKKLGWSKDDNQDKRRRTALRNRHGNLLKTARALQALSNVTKDKETKTKSHSDAQFFYRKYAKKRR